MNDPASRTEKLEKSSPPYSPAEPPTIVTGRAPLPCPTVSDSTHRILEGRIMPGDRIGDFELIEYVGGGGMGRVFRARDVRLQRIVALKVLSPEQAADSDALQRFQNEAQSAARLDHENIARVYGAGQDRNLSYIAFEFVEGENVRRLIERRGPLPPSDAIGYTLQIAEGLSHADTRAVVHRDIKPSNVLITPEGRVKLIDMGLARLRQVDSDVADLTASGVTLGTFDYISPEQARDPRNADVRSDIYSLGCTLFYMLAGRPPFPEGTVLQKLLQHQGDEPPDIRTLRDDVPEDLAAVLHKMMAKDPRHRHADPDDLMDDLVAVADRLGVRFAVPTARRGFQRAVPPPESRFRRHIPWMAPVVVLVCAVVLLDRFFWTPREETPQPPTIADVSTPKTGAVTIAVPPDEPVAGNRDDRSVFDRVAAPPSSDATPPLVADIRKSRPDSATSTDLQRDAAGRAVSDGMATLIVCDNPTGEREFSNLGAACAAARDGDVVELRFNGPREERPMKISNIQLTVRPGSGFRPVVLFRPTEINPIKYPRSMFTLAGGRLTLTDVAVELDVPRDLPADSWSLIETWGGQTLRLERCSLSVRNASEQLTTYHSEVAFLRSRPAPDAGVAAEVSPAAAPLATIELIDSAARGEAVFLCVEELQPVYLLWDNGLLVTTDMLLSAGGGQAATKPDEVLRLELRHVTAVVRGGLCRLNNTSANPYQRTVQFVCADNIIQTAPGVPLVRQDGSDGVEKSRQRVVWNGDRNCYQDVDVFWLVHDADPDVAPDAMDFDAWKLYWGPSRENRPSREPLNWKRPPSVDRPLHAHTAADYTLDVATFDDAAADAPGCRTDRLPPLPSETFWERSFSSGSAQRDTAERRDNRG